MNIHDLKIGDHIKFEDAAYGYRGIIRRIEPYETGWKITLNNNREYYFIQEDLSLYNMQVTQSRSEIT